MVKVQEKMDWCTGLSCMKHIGQAPFNNVPVKVKIKYFFPNKHF